uniref:Mitochondrial inner membrane protein Mpv17 n=1 Tax=Hirondellea gigas TaxID=1518452 RepID=A0A2P2IC57_9CRUS
MALGDITAQFMIERRSLEQYQWRRSANFFTIGTFMVGPCQKVWYYVLDKRFGSMGMKGILKKVLVDQAVFAPTFMLVGLSVYGVLQRKSVDEIKSMIRRDYTDIVLTGWMVWPAVQLCNFSLVPLQHQVLVVQSIALFWNTYLAWKINRESQKIPTHEQ